MLESTPQYPSNQQIARNFIEGTYDQSEINWSDVQDLEPVAADNLISYPFKYKFPVTDEQGVGATEILLADLDNSGVTQGFGEVSFVEGSDNPRIKGKPYVAYTETLEVGKHKGLNVRRLQVMNELAKLHFGYPLHSDHSGDTEPEARASWDKLVSQGLAELYDEEGLGRYRFK